MVLVYYIASSIQQILSIVNANQYQKYKTMNPSYMLELLKEDKNIYSQKIQQKQPPNPLL